VAQQVLAETVQRAPQLCGLHRSRWWLAGLRQAVPWLQTYSLPGVWQLLRRFGIRYKRGRRYVHSPDLAYADKVTHLAEIRAAVEGSAGRAVLVYEDELTYYRRPTVAQGYGQVGQDDVRAQQGQRSNLHRRVAGCLNALTGQLFVWQRKQFDRRTLIRFFQALAASYPDAEVIYVALDNWPVHFHPDVLAALPACRIVLVPLPTYAPWTNPIEKVWRKLYHEVLHLHTFVDHWPELQVAVEDFLAAFAQPSPQLLRYVGLLTD
jgi:hypothetical protein